MSYGDSLVGLELGGYHLLMHAENGMPSGKVANEDQADNKQRGPFTETITYGPWGVGASLPVVRNQFHWGIGLSPEPYDELEPGPLLTAAGYAWDAPATNLRPMSDDGTDYPVTMANTTVADSATVGTLTWANVNNVKASDNAYATISFTGAAEVSHYLIITGLSLALVAAASINGVRITVEHSYTGDVGELPAVQAYIVKAGTPVVASVKTLTAPTGAADTTVIGGSLTDLWSATAISSTDANLSTFGIALKVTSHAALTVPGDYRVDAVTITVNSAPANRYLYASEDNKLHKIRLHTIGANAAFTEIAAALKTFTHGDSTSAPTVSDMAVLKESAGAAATAGGGGRFSSSASGSNCRAIVGFAGQAQIQQIDSIGYDAADTYGSLAATKAYGGRFAFATGRTNTKTLVWKSVGYASGSATSPGPTGAFHRVKSAEILNTTQDLTDETAGWGSTTPYKVGDFGSDINDMAEWQQGLHVGKPEAVYAFSETYASWPRFGMRNYRSPENAHGLLAFGEDLIIPTSQDLMALPASGDATIGLTTLISQRTVYGYPTHISHFGKWLFVSYYDGADSYIFKLRRAVRENVPHPFLWFPLGKITGHKVRTLQVVDDGQTSPTYYLVWDQPSATPTKYDLGYLRLAPRSALRYALSGTWESSLHGSTDTLTRLTKLTFFGENVDSNNYFLLAISWDGGAYSNLGYITSSGRQEFNFTPGTNDSGYRYRLRLTSTLAASTNRPVLIGSGKNVTGDSGGIIVEGIRQPEDVDTIEFQVIAADESQDSGWGGDADGEADEVFDGLKALKQSVIDMTSEWHFGNQTARKVTLMSVGYVFGRPDSPHPPPRYINLRVRRLQE